MTTQNKHTDLKASELIKYRALVMATLDYYIENFSGGEYFKSLKLQTEEHFKKGRLTILKQWFRDCTEQQVETLDFKFNDYLQNKTGYKLDIFQDYYERVDKILTKGKISTDNQFYDVSSMVDKLCQTEPIDTMKINNLNSLLTDFEKRKTKPRRNKNDA